MKWKTIVSIVLVLVAVVLVFNYFGVGGGRLMSVQEGEKFNIKLESTPGDEYKWNADFDTEYLKFLGAEQETGTKTEEQRKVFVFKAVEKGATKIEFDYSRPGKDERSRKERVYRVFIK